MSTRRMTTPAVVFACLVVLGAVLGSQDLTTVLSSAIRLSVPLLFAALGEYVAERSGTLNISVEAMMLSGAYSAAVGSSA